ncbi:Annexin A6 [Clonorchis sinensis]|uniref:Annexin n=1 Tax=Clonorchis sinensis TaxID=79923 RepID=A0A8T1MKG2_CLOSI|nr:Annexin A6 [Clonorchis sinensis]
MIDSSEIRRYWCDKHCDNLPTVCQSRLIPFLCRASDPSFHARRMASGSGFGFQRSLFHRLGADGKMLRPTIEPTPGFSASADAERLHRAMKGAGTDEDTLINILARRTNHERQQICATYESLYHTPLRKVIKDDTSGQFRTVLCELCHDLPYILAKGLYYAMKGLGTNDRVLIEVLTSLWNDEVKAVSDAYKQVLEHEKVDRPDRTLLSDLVSDTSNHFQYALSILAQGQRDDLPALQLKAVPEKGVATVVNKELTEVDAKELLAAGASRVGTSEKRITRIITGRTTFQLAADAEAYERMFGKPLLDDMNSELSGDYRSLIIALIRYATDRANLLAEWLHDAMTGLGTKDYALMRLLITRSEIDLQEIKEAYEKKYNKSLANAIRGDTSGDYMKTLLALLGEQ